MIDIQAYINEMTDMAIRFAPRLLASVLILWLGFKVARRLEKVFARVLERTSIEPEMLEFFKSLLEILLKFIVILLAAGVLGFKVSSLLGILAAIGFAVGLALQGFLGNFASGLTIVFFKPYRVGDWVKISDKFGRVKNIQIFNTILVTPGEKTLVIPNGQVTDNIITNFSAGGRIRLELTVYMPYEENFPKVKEVISEALLKAEYIMQEPLPLIGIDGYDSHSIAVSVKPYINPDYYWDATFEVYELIKAAFNDANIKVAYSEGVELGPIGR